MRIERFIYKLGQPIYIGFSEALKSSKTWSGSPNMKLPTLHDLLSIALHNLSWPDNIPSLPCRK